MKTLTLALFALAFASCGDDNSNQPDMTILPDFAMSIDMAMLVPDGIKCGSNTCSTSMVCCLKPGGGMTVQYSCMAPGTCGDGGAEARCDGPEDCPGKICCVNARLRAAADGGVAGGGGNSMCVSDCEPQVAPDFSSAQTKLCKQESDCAGYEGIVAFN